MKVVTPEISWHEQHPVYSVDFQPGNQPIKRLASGGVDKIVRIWRMTINSDGGGDFEFLSNLRRHTATVNVVRFSPDGSLLATAGDDTSIILWKLSDVPVPANNIFADDDAEEDKETWVCHKSLRGHLGDVADLSWSKDNRYLVSGSVDNTAIVWDAVKGSKFAMFGEHKSYVQGVAFDPLGNFIATLSADRSLRVYNISSKSCVHNVSKMTAPVPASTSNTSNADDTVTDVKPKAFRIFHDDSLRSFFRRLEFSPDGQLLITPAGCMEIADKPVNTSFVFSRAAFVKPAMYLPCGGKSSTVVRINPQLFQFRPVEITEDESSKDIQPEWQQKKSLFCLPYRIVYAVATEDCVLIYDTQQTIPIGLLRNIHYHQISDLAWTSDGRTLIVSSTDGYCTVATFAEGELGELYVETTNTGEAQISKATDPGREVDKMKVETAVKSSLMCDKKSEQKTAGITNKSNIESTKQIVQSDSKTGGRNEDGVDAKPDLTEVVESIKIEENKKCSRRIDLSSAGTVKSVTEGSNKEEQPKKKRIQFTTLSLLNE